MLNNKKKRTCDLVTFTVLANHGVKIKECEKIDKYLDLAREMKRLWNIKLMVIPIVIDMLGTVPKGLEKMEIWVRIKTMQITDQREYSEESWGFEGTYCHSDFKEKPSIRTSVKNLQL